MPVFTASIPSHPHLSPTPTPPSSLYLSLSPPLSLFLSLSFELSLLSPTLVGLVCLKTINNHTVRPPATNTKDPDSCHWCSISMALSSAKCTGVRRTPGKHHQNPLAPFDLSSDPIHPHCGLLIPLTTTEIWPHTFR